MRKILIGAIALALAAPAAAQEQPETRIVSVYRAAPGHQQQLLEWLARQDEVGRAAGVPAAQLYVHQNGANWDYMIVSTQATPEQDRAADQAARRMGAPTGPRAGLELRQHIAEHTDTIVAGPTTAAEWLRRLRQ
jgi:membrane-bound lytic murein transglycosylase B